MDIKQLKYFQVIAEEKHITAAAKKLNMSQPPLSQQLKLLESELGCPLFIRTSKSMELTAEGKYLLEQANYLLKNHDSILSSFMNRKNGTFGFLNIGSICSAATNYLPKSLAEFNIANEEIQTQVFEDTSTNILKMIDHEEVELGIVKEPFDHNQYEYHYINSLNKRNHFVSIGRSHWFSPLNDNVSLPDLDNAPLILHNTHRAVIIRTFEAAGMKARVAWTANNIHSMLRWADQDLGIAIMPYDSSLLFKYMAGSKDVLIKALDSPCFFSHTSLVWSKNHTLTHSAILLINFLKSKEVMISHRNQIHLSAN